MDDAQEVLGKRDLARAAMKARTKIVKRKSLAPEKEGTHYPVSRKGNMIAITGYECDGLQTSPWTMIQFFLFAFLGIMCVHLFTKNTPYRSVNPIKEHSSFTRSYVTALGNETVVQPEAIVDPIQSMINMTEELTNTTSEVEIDAETVEEPAAETDTS